MTERLELVVLACLELLVLQPLDAGFAGADVEFDVFDGQFDGLHGCARLFDAGLIPGKLGARPRLEIWHFLEILEDVADFLVAFLDFEQFDDFRQHGVADQ